MSATGSRALIDTLKRFAGSSDRAVAMPVDAVSHCQESGELSVHVCWLKGTVPAKPMAAQAFVRGGHDEL